MRITLGQKILAGFLASALILLTVAILSFRNNAKVVDAAQWVKHTQEVLYELEQLTLGCVNAETGERGFVITGRESYLEPFNLAKQEIYVHLNRVRDLTRDNAVQQRNIDAIGRQIDEFLARMELCARVRRVDGFDSAKIMVNSDIGKIMLDNLRMRINVALKAERVLLDVREKVSDEDTANFNRLFMALLIIIGLVLVSVYFIITVNLKALRKLEAETAAKNWALTGAESLARGLEGNKNVKELSYAVISHFATYFDLPAAAFYLVNENQASLALSAFYSVDPGRGSPLFIDYGKGIVGQAAKDNKPVMMKDLSADYFLVHSGFGDLKPKCIVAVPFSFEGTVIGVIELAALRAFKEIEMEYLRVVSPSIGIAIISGVARKKTADLLEETQHLAEELNVQQEELKQSNDELQQKTNLLEESEQELKAQQEELELVNKELEYKAEMLEEQKDRIENSKILIEAKAGEVEMISRYKSEFLANMSHELRTPLNSILILSQLLGENKSNNLSDKEINFSKSIYSSGNDLLNLINEILDLSKIESGKMELEIETVSLGSVVDQLQSLFGEVAKNKQLNFSIQLDKSLEGSAIKTDGQRMQQIIKNLLSNAFKFTPKNGSVTLRIDPAVTTPSYIQHAKSPAMLAFAVIDTGIGIPENKRSVVFEAFQQADGSTKRQYGGTGLGLSISRELARALGGEIALQSEEGKGSTFTLYLPVSFDASMIVSEKTVEVSEKPEIKRPAKVQAPAVAEGQEPAPANDDRNNIGPADRLVLIIEDDEAFALGLLDFIRKRNFKGVIANQGNTGISYARHYRPDAIILDIQLPVMDGMEVLKLIKNDPDLRHIPVQIVSGHDKKRKGFELGAFDFIQKPVSTDDLRRAFDKIEKFINKKLKKLLVVEDSKPQSDAIIELVGSQDIKCFAAYNGADAISLLKKEEFDCMIVDLNLPDMTGFELLETVKADAAMNKTPVVVYTGKDLNKEENARLMKLANSVVLKTVNSQERLLDETVLFLHKVESKLPKEKQNMIRKLHKTDEVLKNKKVLLVDDDMRNIYSLSNVLEEEGVHCIVAENGKAALNELARHPDMDLVLMDVMMPEMDGYEATMQIRKTKGIDKIPIIALTAKAMKGDREKCLAAGMSDYITKPVDVNQLLSLMRVWLYK